MKVIFHDFIVLLIFCFEQAHNLDKAQLKLRTVKTLDLVDPIPDSPDPTTFVSEKTGKGKLEKGWIVCSLFTFLFFIFIKF